MGNIATSITKQIEILKSRNMTLDVDENKVKEILLDIGYYRLGFYWHPFEIDKKHNFKEGTKFSDVVKLYYLDVNLRGILTKYLNRIELNFRTKLIYYVSNKYKYSPTWFIDHSVVSSEFIKNFELHYDENFINDNKTLRKHHSKYINDKYAPAWKTLEFLTFGAISKIYKSLNESEIQIRISELYGVRNHHKFINLLNTIVYVRNCCAHSSVLFDLTLSKSISAFSEIQFNSSNRHNLDACIKVILYMVGKISENRKKDMENEINDLFNSHIENETIKNIVKNKIGHTF